MKGPFRILGYKTYVTLHILILGRSHIIDDQAPPPPFQLPYYRSLRSKGIQYRVTGTQYRLICIDR